MIAPNLFNPFFYNTHFFYNIRCDTNRNSNIIASVLYSSIATIACSPEFVCSMHVYSWKNFSIQLAIYDSIIIIRLCYFHESFKLNLRSYLYSSTYDYRISRAEIPDLTQNPHSVNGAIYYLSSIQCENITE